MAVKKYSKIFDRIIPVIKSKYFIAFFVFTLWVGLFDDNNLIERYTLSRDLKQLEKDKSYYLEQIQKDAARLLELQTNADNLEKYAREQYLMHRNDEDVFIIVEE